MYIKALEGRDSKNNRLIIEALAFNSSSIKWDIRKSVGEVSWATVSRRVDDLKDRGYIMETGKRRITVAKRDEDTPEYGLTWKGFIASLASSKIREDIVEVIEKNLHIEPLNKIWSLVKGVYTEDEVKYITQHLFEIFELMTVNLETANELEFFFNFGGALTKTDFEFPDSIKDKLGRSPKFLTWLYEALSKQERESMKKLKQIQEWKTEIKEQLKNEV